MTGEVKEEFGGIASMALVKKSPLSRRQTNIEDFESIKQMFHLNYSKL